MWYLIENNLHPGQEIRTFLHSANIHTETNFSQVLQLLSFLQKSSEVSRFPGNLQDLQTVISLIIINVTQCLS